MAKKIAMHQGQGEYPSLHITITDNPRYHEGRLCYTDAEKALEKIATWLKKKIDG